MYFLYDHLIPGTFVNCYADTDSMALATTRTRPFNDEMPREEQLRAVFDPIVKPEMRQSWEENWKSWFVTTNTVEDERYPGKLKRKLIFVNFLYPVIHYIFRRIPIFQGSLCCPRPEELFLIEHRKSRCQNGLKRHPSFC